MTLHDRALALFERWDATDPGFQALLLEEEGLTSEEIEAETGVVVSICYFRVGGPHGFCILDPLLASCSCLVGYAHRCPAHLGSSWAWRSVIAEVIEIADLQSVLVDLQAYDGELEAAITNTKTVAGYWLATTGWCPRGMGRHSVPEMEGWA